MLQRQRLLLLAGQIPLTWTRGSGRPAHHGPGDSLASAYESVGDLDRATLLFEVLMDLDDVERSSCFNAGPRSHLMGPRTGISVLPRTEVHPAVRVDLSPETVRDREPADRPVQRGD